MQLKPLSRASLAALSLTIGLTLAGHGTAVLAQPLSAISTAQTFDFDIASGPSTKRC